jgi:uncharacterized protein YbjT (DUF2867 family)
MKIFLAGASGVVGQRLTLFLLVAGHAVVGTTRSAERAAHMKVRGAEAVIVDVFDAAALRAAVVAARPDVVIHQLTDLPQVLDPEPATHACASKAPPTLSPPLARPAQAG